MSETCPQACLSYGCSIGRVCDVVTSGAANRSSLERLAGLANGFYSAAEEEEEAPEAAGEAAQGGEARAQRRRAAAAAAAEAEAAAAAAEAIAVAPVVDPEQCVKEKCAGQVALLPEDCLLPPTSPFTPPGMRGPGGALREGRTVRLRPRLRFQVRR